MEAFSLSTSSTKMALVLTKSLLQLWGERQQNSKEALVCPCFCLFYLPETK